MRVDRFREWVAGLLAQPGCRVEWWTSEDGHRNPAVHCEDGTVWFLWLVRTSPPGGDDFAQPEVIATKRVDAPKQSG